MKLNNESDILRQEFRKNVIEEIRGSENAERKKEMLKRYEVYRDGSKKYVIEQLKKELDAKTVEEMIHRTPNLGFSKKIIKKKASVFQAGAQFKAEKKNGRPVAKKTQDQIDSIAAYVNLSSKLKKLNRFEELFRNTTAYIKPIEDKDLKKWYYKILANQPHLYDVIEDADDPEKMRVYIFSYAIPAVSMGDARTAQGFRDGAVSSSDGIDQTIADSPNDFEAEKQRYVWWSKNYNFTTDGKGEIVSEAGKIDNAIKQLTVVNFAKDQDGQFWALGGGDITDGAILLNQILADLYFIAKVQGNGIFYFFGKGVPKSMKIGPNFALTHEVADKDDPEPKAGFMQANPLLSEYMAIIEQYLAFLLTTNELDAGSISGKLSATNTTSAVHEVIKKADNVADVQDQRQMYVDNVPAMFDIIIKWHNLLHDRKLLIDELQAIGKVPEDVVVNLEFIELPIFMSEKERLEVIEKRKDLGLDSHIDAIMRDNPGMDRAAAEARFKQITEDKIIEMREKVILPMMNNGANNGGQSNEEDQNRLPGSEGREETTD